jgi:hypothetical protein
MTGTVLAAIDLGLSSARVQLHAAGFARLFGVPLKVMHVAAGDAAEHRRHVFDFCVKQGPYEVDFDQETIVVRQAWCLKRSTVKRSSNTPASW